MHAYSQEIDSTLESLQQIPTKYITGINRKVDQYTNRITNKTEKTLTKLSRWENKIKNLLEKTSPETATRLFGNNQLTFTSLLEKVKQGEAVALQYKAPYNKYQDDVTTGLKYLAQQKQQLDSGLIKKVKASSNKMQELADEEDKSEAIQQFIKERKKQLIEQAFVHIGKSKYLTKINKEAYYYTETLKNYKELFSNTKKAEETVKGILAKIPTFRDFVKENSMLSSLFSLPDNYGSAGSLEGMQVRSAVSELLQQRVAVGGPNAVSQVQENMRAAQGKLNDLKDKMIKQSVGSSEEISDVNFKPNTQKTKTFLQRIELGSNLQFSRYNTFMPGIADIALNAGYKISDKSIIGIGASFKLGMGTLERVRFTNQGSGLRSFCDWKLRKQFYLSGGYEMNYLTSAVTAFQQQKSVWLPSGLLGVSKRIALKTKWLKGSNLQLLYDLLSRQHNPGSSPILFRVGYGFNK